MKALILLTFILSVQLFAKGVIYSSSELLAQKGRWGTLSVDEESSLRQIFQILQESPYGKRLYLDAVAKSQRSQKDIFDIVIPGHGSVTDSTLVRRFPASNPLEVSYEVRAQVYLSRSLTVSDAVLDLAHELTHYLYRPPLNPYTPSFTLESFMYQTIEGRGGEAEAFLSECQVLKELWNNSDKWKNSKCQKLQKNGEFSHELAAYYFYQIGAYHENFFNLIQEFSENRLEFSKIGQDDALFISSAYGLPYPMAVIEEYRNVREKSCQNDKRRLALIKNQNGRATASTTLSSQVELDYQERCRGIQ